jgi:hypothetical protein
MQLKHLILSVAACLGDLIQSATECRSRNIDGSDTRG